MADLKADVVVVAGGQALLRTELTQVQESLRRCEEERAALAGSVPSSLLSRYERIRGHGNGQAVVPVTNGVCGGCFRRLPPQVALEVRTEQEIISCQFCGRMLYAEKEEPATEV